MSRVNSFTCQDVYKTLSEAKQAHNGEFGWWNSCLEWSLDTAKNLKRDKISVTYINLKYTNYNGNWGRLIIDAFDEKNQGSINPVHEADAELLQSHVPERKFGNKIQARGSDKAYVKIKKYTTRVRTVDNAGIELVDGETLPGPEHQSMLYKVTELYNEAFVNQFQYWVDNGVIQQAGTRKKQKTDVKPLMIGNVNIRSIVHDAISEADMENPLAGQPLINPTVKLQLKHDFINDCFDNPNENKPMLSRKTRILDAETQQIAMVDGEPVKNSNVHRYITYGCMFNATLDLGNVCCSSAGISSPITIIAIVVRQPEIMQQPTDMFSKLFTKPATAATPAVDDDEEKPEPITDEAIIGQIQALGM